MGDISYFAVWYRGHTNARYEQLVPRLERVDPTLIWFPRQRVPRAVVQRTWNRTRRFVEPAIVDRLQKRHRYAFATDVAQLEWLRVPTIVDVDDPYYSPEHVALLHRAAAYVVTAERTAREYEALGVETPWYVVPQGASAPRVQERAADAGPVVGYLAAFLLLPEDRGGHEPLYDVSHLLELWDEISARIPGARLELAGLPGAALRRRLHGRQDIVLTGRLPRGELMQRVTAWDVALYPRTADQGIRASKVAEYLAAGVPIVSYDYEVVADVREAGAGLLVGTPREFVDAVVRLLEEPNERERLAAAARAAGAARDWDVLAEQYRAILDAHLPPVH